MEKKSKYKHWIVISIVALSLLISPISAFATNTYEYNDVRVYLNGTYQTKVALTSDSWITDTLYFQVRLNTNTGYIEVAAQAGDWISTDVAVTDYTNITATQNGDYLSSYTGSGGYLTFSGVYVPGFSEVYLYITGTAPGSGGGSSTNKLADPVVTLNGSYISWQNVANADSYTIGRNDGTSFNSSYASTTSRTYQLTESGTYNVKANGSGDYSDSDWSNTITFDVNDYDDTTDNIVDRVNGFINNIKEFFHNIEDLVSEVGNVFNALTGFLPATYANMLWSLAAVLLIFGLFRLL